MTKLNHNNIIAQENGTENKDRYDDLIRVDSENSMQPYDKSEIDSEEVP